MTGFDMGGRLPIYGRVGQLTPGAIALFIILLAAAAAVAVVAIRTRMNGARTLELTLKARVAEKRETKGGMECRVTFELAEGETRTFRLSASDAGRLREGQEGQLTAAGKKFISFQ